MNSGATSRSTSPLSPSLRSAGPADEGGAPAREAAVGGQSFGLAPAITQAAASPSIERTAVLDERPGPWNRTRRCDVAVLSMNTGGRRVPPYLAVTGQSSEAPRAHLPRCSRTSQLLGSPGRTFPGARACDLPCDRPRARVTPTAGHGDRRARGNRRQTSNLPGAVHRRPLVCPGLELHASGAPDLLSGRPGAP